jgi:hypothetical protein
MQDLNDDELGTLLRQWRARERRPHSKIGWWPRQDFRACNVAALVGYRYDPSAGAGRHRQRSFCCSWLFSQYVRRQALTDSSRFRNSNQD